MARVYVDPDRLEEFARRLAEFSREVNLIYSNLDGRLKSLNATWRDQEYEKFKDAFADLQKLLLEEGVRAGDEMTRLTLAKQDDYIAQFEKAGVTFVKDVDVPAFQAKTASVYEAFPKWTPGLHAKIQAILAQ
jgi:hypothetical protein